MEKSVTKVAKIEQITIGQKMIIQPHALRNEFPKNPVPFLTDNGIVFDLVTQPMKSAKINSEGDMMADVVYKAQQLTILNRYVEVEIIDEDDDDRWIGSLFGINVEGTGGSGNIRGCLVTGIDNNVISVKGFNQRNNSAWLKVKKEVEKRL